MADGIQTTDKTELSSFLQLLSNAVLDAVTQVEAKHPDWRATSLALTARGVLKPATIGGKPAIVIDIDEPANEPISEITIPLQREQRTVATT